MKSPTAPVPRIKGGAIVTTVKFLRTHVDAARAFLPVHLHKYLTGPRILLSS